MSQVATELHVSPQRVRQLIAAGWLRARKVNPRLLLVRSQDLRAVRVRKSWQTAFLAMLAHAT